jgi:hypothetical protein
MTHLKPSRLIPDDAYLFGVAPRYTWAFSYHGAFRHPEDPQLAELVQITEPLEALRVGVAQPDIVHVYNNDEYVASFSPVPVLQEFMRECVADLMFLWPDVPSVIQHFIETGEGREATEEMAQHYYFTEAMVSEIFTNVAWAVVCASRENVSRSNVIWIVEACKRYGIQTDYNDLLESKLINAIQSKL